MRFKQKLFDVLIIDEIDAFPFDIDRSLQYALKKLKKKRVRFFSICYNPVKICKTCYPAKKISL